MCGAASRDPRTDSAELHVDVMLVPVALLCRYQFVAGIRLPALAWALFAGC